MIQVRMRPFFTHLLLPIVVLLSSATASLFGQQQQLLFETLPPESGLSHSAITSTIQDRYGFLWLGSWSGLVRYDGYSVQRYDNVAGLESNKITAIYEGPNGQLWVGTRNAGLYCYDRAADRMVPASQVLGTQNKLTDPNITALSGDASGGLWVGTENGLNYFDPQKKQFRTFYYDPNDPTTLGNNFIYALAQTADGAVWVGTTLGLNRIAPGWETAAKPHFDRYLLGPAGQPERAVQLWNFIYTLVPSTKNAPGVWAGSKSGLHFIRFDTNNPAVLQVTSYRHNSATGNISHDYVRAIQETDTPSEGSVWVGTIDGLNCLDLKTGRTTAFFNKSKTPFSISNNYIYTLCLDHSGIMWIGTEKGLNKLNFKAGAFALHTFDNPDRSGNSMVFSLARSPQNRIWAGTHGSGLFGIPVVNGQTQWDNAARYSLLPANNGAVGNYISMIAADGAGNLWIATHEAGVLQVNEKKLPGGGGTVSPENQFLKGNGPLNISDDCVMSLATTDENDLWIGCWDGGVNFFDRTENRIYQFPESSDKKADFRHVPIISLRETPDPAGGKWMWVSTRGSGIFLLKFDKRNHVFNLIKHFYYQSPQQYNISNNFITSMVYDQFGQFWVTTENGLNLFDPEKQIFKLYSDSKLLPNPVTQGLAIDARGRHWISTQGGIAAIVEKDGQLQTSAYDSRDGLREQFFNSEAVLLSPNGRILMGGANGITEFDPNAIQSDQTAPKVAITGMRLFNQPVQVGMPTANGFILEKSLLETTCLVLSHDDNMVTFEFSALHFAHPDKNKFAYKLEGFNEDWINTDARERVAHFTNLPHGEYTLLVKAANGDGVWCDAPARLKIKVLPPWWLTWWAYLIYAALFGALLYGVRRFTLFRANLKNAVKMERLEKEKLEEINQMKLLFFTNISHELKTPLTLIISPLEELIKNRSTDNTLQNTFSRMHRNAAKLLTMINQLLDIRKTEAGLMKLEVGEGNLVQFVGEVVISFRELARQKNIDLLFNPEKKLVRVWFDPDQLEKVFYNILSNAFKYTPENGKIIVEIAEDALSNTVQIRISDTGKGIAPDKIAYIFDRFYQAEEHHEQGAQGGTGIGLSLAKSVVEQHHGEIGVESEPHKGAIFTVKIPLGSDHFTATEKKNNFTSGENLAEYSVVPETETPAGLIPRSAVRSDGNKPVLLLVEDNHDIRTYLRESLLNEYQIEEADNGDEGLDTALRITPDLVICDISMPGMDGIELCRHLKTRIETSHIPVILLTARTALIFKIDGLETGADDYITKPFNLNLLRLRIRNLIESRQKLREKFSRNLQLHPTEVALPSLDEAFIKKVMDILEENLEDSDFSIDELAHKLLMSRMQVYRKLKALTDQTPNELIRTIRLKRAAQLLKSGQFTVAEVTYKVGFQDLKYFRERFKEEFGVNPSEY